MKLNIGAGSAKLEGYINMDISEECKPDIVHDFRKGIPYPPDHFDKIVCFHMLEHVEKKYHQGLFLEIKRTLKEDGEFIVTFPDFAKCAQNWLENEKGQREFWEATIYGRQLYPSDYHVCACTVDNIARQLARLGLDPYYQGYEGNSQFMQDCNGVIKARKAKVLTYEEVLVGSNKWPSQLPT